ncbi:uncharacterized protein RCC_07679 [Ramularia collo-cygni]|uniref:Uncharacterized protein n=1 Tax=Ramularia collo-cygni TaxID=112498 RepID=A0A2D3UVP1_9PEZI|nr:uncharacterized protein RCC_07679 [Ramularia collo-cygni]CZT21812.1 uncharacterized protein RCC_07679 [Ramularia collo-cygni]
MSTSIQDWNCSQPAKTEERPPSSFGEQLTRVKAHDNDHHVAWQIDEKAPDDTAIPRQTLQKIYLSPPIDVQGDFRNIFANPTPLGLVGFLVATVPVSFQLMGIRGSGGGGAATGQDHSFPDMSSFQSLTRTLRNSCLSLFFGGMLQIIACLMEWMLGNTFSFLVFGSFGAAWFALACTNLPMFGAMTTYTAGLTDAHAIEAAQAEFYSSFGKVTCCSVLISNHANGDNSQHSDC